MSSFYTRAEMQTLKTLLEAEFQSAQERSYPIKVRDPRAQALVKKYMTRSESGWPNSCQKTAGNV